MAKQKLKVAVCGYGGAFNMGRAHARELESTGRAKLVAGCDVDRERVKAAESDFPGVATFTGLSSLLKRSDAELVVIITPHNTHAKLTLAALKSGRHVVVEKPMCLTSAEGRSMVRAAKAGGVMLSCYHNRRWDPDYLTIKKLVAQGAVGEVYDVRCHMARFGMKTDWWRANKRISGGCLYDWGAHMVDWVLGLVPSKIASVTGFSQKRRWPESTNEDEARVLIRFANGVTGDVMVSHLRQTADSPKWEVCGTKGSLRCGWRSSAVEVCTQRKGRTVVEYVPMERQDWAAYYANVVRHVLDGEELVVKGEQAARVIAVIEAQGKSARSGRAVKIAGG